MPKAIVDASPTNTAITTIIAAVAGRRIKVRAIVADVAANTRIAFYSGGAGSPIYLVNMAGNRNQHAHSIPNDRGMFIGGVGEAIGVSSDVGGGGVAFTATIDYELI